MSKGFIASNRITPAGQKVAEWEGMDTLSERLDQDGSRLILAKYNPVKPPPGKWKATFSSGWLFYTLLKPGSTPVLLIFPAESCPEMNFLFFAPNKDGGGAQQQQNNCSNVSSGCHWIEEIFQQPDKVYGVAEISVNSFPDKPVIIYRAYVYTVKLPQGFDANHPKIHQE